MSSYGDKVSNFSWALRDEGQYEFMRQKYHDRRALEQAYDEKRKLADKSETINGKPNPQHPRLVIEAEMAQQRYEMAYIIDRNTMLQEQLEALSWLANRVSILEGAYGHLNMMTEQNKLIHSQVTASLRKMEKADGAKS